MRFIAPLATLTASVTGSGPRWGERGPHAAAWTAAWNTEDKYLESKNQFEKSTDAKAQEIIRETLNARNAAWVRLPPHEVWEWAQAKMKTAQGHSSLENLRKP
jgi:hypothetical protein